VPLMEAGSNITAVHVGDHSEQNILSFYVLLFILGASAYFFAPSRAHSDGEPDGCLV